MKSFFEILGSVVVMSFVVVMYFLFRNDSAVFNALTKMVIGGCA